MLRPDSDRQLQQMRGHLVPDGSGLPNDYVLSITGQSPFEYDWRQPKDAEILRGHGSPDGVKFATKGSLYVDVDAPALWQNDDGLSSWTQVGASAGSFPIIFDDGTYTYEIAAPTDPSDFANGDTVLTLAVWQNADPTQVSILSLSADDMAGVCELRSRAMSVSVESDFNVNLAATLGIGISSNGAIDINGASGVSIEGTGANPVTIGPALELVDAPLAGGPYLLVNKTTDPGSAPADKGWFYLRDNGAGKMQFVAKFPSGAVQVIATEP